MTDSQLNHFCGNPQNHHRHSWGLPVPIYICDGVGIEAEDVYTEKYDPTLGAMDGTTYSKITIMIEDLAGNVTTIHAPKASFMQFEVEHEKYVAIDVVDSYRPPRIEKAILEFQPAEFGDEPPFTITRKKANEA